MSRLAVRVGIPRLESRGASPARTRRSRGGTPRVGGDVARCGVFDDAGTPRAACGRRTGGGARPEIARFLARSARRGAHARGALSGVPRKTRSACAERSLSLFARRRPKASLPDRSSIAFEALGRAPLHLLNSGSFGLGSIRPDFRPIRTGARALRLPRAGCFERFSTILCELISHASDRFLSFGTSCPVGGRACRCGGMPDVGERRRA